MLRRPRMNPLLAIFLLLFLVLPLLLFQHSVRRRQSSRSRRPRLRP